MTVGQTITQNDINEKLFHNFEKIEEKMERFESKMAERMDKFETKIHAQLSWQLAIFTIIMVGVLDTIITS
ncbi:MAG: hypothetical protein QM504_13890 [Pseudomonadota bacterium]